MNLDRFWDRVEKTASCWLWRGPCNRNGYAVWSYNENSKRIPVLGHRLSWSLENTDIPKGMCICHKCDVKHCVNPNHLFLGTYKDNMQDAVHKGRMASGDRHGSRTHPERVPRGLKSGRYTKPERTARGERHGSRTHPERCMRGEKSHTAKLTWAKVAEIRAQTAHVGTTTQLARVFGISYSTLRRIVRRDYWKPEHRPCVA